MKSFHNVVQKFVTGGLLLIVAFTATYIPQPFNEIKEAHALASGSVVSVPISDANSTVTSGTTGATAASTATSAGFDGTINYKELTADMLLWAMAKQTLSNMVSSIVNWINTGFEGSPSFVQDLDRFLLNTADETLGRFLAEMEDLSFLCDPFRLDVRIALATIKSETRNNNAPSCTVSGALEYIESFMSGNFYDGGWEAWLEITTAPETYTSYGQYLTAERLAEAKVEEAKTRESTLLGYGSGFLSSRICETIGGQGSMQNCVISTPGKAIQEALSFQLEVGGRVLIEADEIGEIIGALFNQLTQTAITGAAGLLGLTSGTGQTYEGYESGSYLGDLALESTVDQTQFLEDMEDALATEERYREEAIAAYPLLLEFAATSSPAHPLRKAAALDEAENILRLLPVINANISGLRDLIARQNRLPDPSADTEVTRNERMAIAQEYTRLRLHNEAIVNAQINNWRRYTREVPITEDEEARRRAEEAQETLDQIEANTSNNNNN
jgi:hypothetical protein